MLLGWLSRGISGWDWFFAILIRPLHGSSGGNASGTDDRILTPPLNQNKERKIPSGFCYSTCDLCSCVKLFSVVCCHLMTVSGFNITSMTHMTSYYLFLAGFRM